MCERLVELLSADNRVINVPEVVADMLHSPKNKHINKFPIQIFGTKLATLALVIDYCKFVAKMHTPQNFPYQCTRQVDLVTLFNLIQAAQHQGIKGLMDITCRILKEIVKYEIKNEHNNQDSSIQQYPAAKSLKRDPSEDMSVGTILRSPGKETFIMIWDCEDVPYHQFVFNELHYINRKNSYFDQMRELTSIFPC